MRRSHLNNSVLLAVAVVSVFSVLGYSVSSKAEAISPLGVMEDKKEFPDDVRDDDPLGLSDSLIDEESKFTFGESFARPVFRDLAQSYLMLGGIDVRITPFLDEYAKLAYCSLYRDKYEDDFEWNSVRQKIKSRVLSKKEYFRVLYELTGVIYLGRYNFNTQNFPLVKNTALYNVGSMSLVFDHRFDYKKENKKVKRDLYQKIFNLCDDEQQTSVFPKEYSVQMAQPLTFDRIKVSPNQAKSLIRRMKIMKNEDRKLYVRFRVNLITVPPDQKIRWNSEKGYVDRRSRGVMHGEMVAIDIFLDKEMSQPIINVPLDNLQPLPSNDVGVQY